MTLLEATRLAIDLTGDLQSAFTADDIPSCEEILVRRADAMGRFEDAHRESSDAERMDCRELIVELKRRDTVLQETAAEAFAAVQEEMRRQFGVSSPPQGSYGEQPVLSGSGNLA